jgi:hypothetical protein
MANIRRLGSSNGEVVTSPAVPYENKMTLAGIIKSKPSNTEKIVLYAPEGWGKTTWASKAEKPVFLSTEDGLKYIKVDTFPEPKEWLDIFGAVETLRNEKHDFKTFVVDTLDWAEHLCQAFLLKRDDKKSIEAYGYGKGYVLAFEEFKKFLVVLDSLRREKEMDIIFLAHSNVKPFSNPTGDNFDRYEMKLDKKLAALTKEWSDCVLFGHYDVKVDERKGYGGDRIIQTNYSPAWDAKNRYGISTPISSNADDFWKIIKGGQK